MKRKIFHALEKWRDKESRMPLIIEGARQVGKTYILKKFGESKFRACHYLNFDEDGFLGKLFVADLIPERIIADLSIYLETDIDVDNDLIIFDEIQECPDALSSLKYFCEKLPNAYVACAGSLLGIKLTPKSFPVGKVEFLNLFPMNFEEFLESIRETRLLKMFRDAVRHKKISIVAHKKLWNLLIDYFFVGGMPRAVQVYVKNRKDVSLFVPLVREIQDNLLKSYQGDFAKHSGKINSVHISSIFANVPIQLSKTINGTTNKYIFKDVISGKKGFSFFDGPVTWLENAGLVIKVKISNKAESPLKAFTKSNQFKLFFFDIGLLGASLNLSAKNIYEQKYGTMKGYFAENFVAQELLASGSKEIISWTERNSEIEFLKEVENKIIPIEVKSGIRTKAKSLSQYVMKYDPVASIILSANELSIFGDRYTIPLYLSGMLGDIDISN